MSSTTQIRLTGPQLVGTHNHPAGAVVTIDTERARAMIAQGVATPHVPGLDPKAAQHRRTTSTRPATRTTAATVGRTDQ